MSRLAALALLTLAAAAPARAVLAPPPDDAPVIGVSFRGQYRAYPLALFSPQRVLNDVIGRQEIVLFHDPAGGTTAAWFRTVLGEPIEFSGEAVGAVADDLSTITRWDLTTGRAVGGNLIGQRLVELPHTRTSWGRWRSEHPNAEAFAATP